MQDFFQPCLFVPNDKSVKYLITIRRNIKWKNLITTYFILLRTIKTIKTYKLLVHIFPRKTHTLMPERYHLLPYFVAQNTKLMFNIKYKCAWLNCCHKWSTWYHKVPGIQPKIQCLCFNHNVTFHCIFPVISGRISERKN